MSYIAIKYIEPFSVKNQGPVFSKGLKFTLIPIISVMFSVLQVCIGLKNFRKASPERQLDI